MKNLIYIILFFSIFTNNVKAQYFNINLGRPDPYLESSNTKALNYQDSLWLININITRYVPGDYAFFPSIIIINNNGEFKKEIYLTDTIIHHYYADWVKVNEKEFDIVGTEYDTANNGSFFKLKLNADLDLQSNIKYNITRDIGDIKRLKKLPNGNFAFCGLIQNYDKINKKTEEEQAVFYLLDSLGNELWHVEYGDSINDEKFFDFTWDLENNFYILGQWTEPYFDADFQDLVVKINKNGKIVWDKKYGTVQQLNGGESIKIMNNNQIVIFSGYKDNILFSDFGKFNFSIIDSLGIINLKKEYGIYGGVIYDCAEDNFGNYVCIGQTDEPDGNKQSGFIVKFAPNGDALWTHIYPLFIEEKKNIQNFYGINITPDGGYILTGITNKKFFPDYAPNAQAWVMKVDSLGYDHISQFPTATYEPEVLPENNIICFFPNPTGGDLFYRWKELAPIVRDRWVVYFYDLEGRLVFTHPMSINNNSIMLQSLATGVYPYVIKDSKNAFITKGKVVVQKRL